MNRRAFLTSAAALTAGVALFGVEERGRIEAEIRRRTDPANRPAGAGVTVHSESFDSTYMKRSVRWMYSIPVAHPVATVFSLHGKSGSAASTFDDLQLHDFIADAKLPLAVASVDGGDDSYWHARRDGTDARSMLINEFIPRVEAVTKTTKRTLYGWSMGGYGALLAAGTHASMFSAVAALSPALWTSPGSSAPGAFDDADDFKKNDVFKLRSVLGEQRVHISVGTSDPFYKSTKTFVAGLPGAVTDYGPGVHDDSYWRRATPAALQFIASSI